MINYKPMTSEMIQKFGGVNEAYVAYKQVSLEDLMKGFEGLPKSSIKARSHNAVVRLFHTGRVSSVAEIASLTDEQILKLYGRDMGPSRISVLNQALTSILETKKK